MRRTWHHRSADWLLTRCVRLVLPRGRAGWATWPKTRCSATCSRRSIPDRLLDPFGTTRSHALRFRVAGSLTSQALSVYLKVLDAIDAALDSGDGGVLVVSEDEDDSEAGATAIVIAWLIARRAVPWAEVQAVVKPCPDLIPNQKT